MADMSWEHAPEARAALNAIVTDPDHGVAALSNAQTMSNLLKDYLPDAPREKSILVAAAEAGLADTLRDHVAQGMDPETAIRLTASSFSSSTPFTPEACNWVADELAVALGISQPRQAGGGAPTGAAAAGSEGMPTRIVPIPSAPGAPGGLQQPQPTAQAPGQGYPQAPAPGFGTPGRPNPQDQPTAKGYRPGYAPGPQPGPQPGGFGQPPGQGYQGQQPQPKPQPQPYQAQRFPGQPVQPYPGQQQPQPYPGQPGRGYPGQPAFPQPGQPGTPAGWAPGGGYGPGGGVGGPPKPTGGRRGLLVAGVIIVLIAAIIVASVFLTKKPSNHPHAGGGSSPAATTPSTSNTPTPSGSVEPLSTIMNPAGFSPVGTNCTKGFLYGLNASTVTARTFCSTTTKENILVWGYQFDSNPDYLAGLAHINSYTGFHRTSPPSGCKNPVATAGGLARWHANANPKYVARAGQVLECFIDASHPTLIWTMPTMNVFFFAWDIGKGDTILRIVSWWETLNYG